MAEVSGVGSIEGKAKETTVFSLKEVKGDLFDSQASLAHCVSADFKMGAGIAKAFRKNFRDVDVLLAQKQGVPGLGVLHLKGRFVYYLVTKEKYWHKPTYVSLEGSLKLLLAHVKKHEVKELAMPRIGCGLDKLDWDKVKKLLEEVFKDSGVSITVYYL